MYFPILRGKQFELIAIRELCSNALELFENFLPIIEPVSDNMKPLFRTIEALNEIGVSPLIVLNPTVGEFETTAIELEEFPEQLNIVPTFYVSSENEDRIVQQVKEVGIENAALFVPEGCSNQTIKDLGDVRYLIIDTSLTQATRYQKGINASVILLDDGFKRKDRNADYQRTSIFKTSLGEYKDFGLGGIADYSITGKFFKESGGPAYVVAIHLTELRVDNDDFGQDIQVVINHYVSDRESKSPKNPAGKFREALEQMFDDISQRPNAFEETIGLKGFRELYNLKHFSGLGIAKKLSVQHHIQTLAKYVKDND